MQKQYRLSDILANAITHGIGVGLAIAAAVVLIVFSTRGTAWHVVSCSIYGATLILVYLCSTLYHSLVLTRARRVFRILDHSAIYLLIAGTYTPFLLVTIRGALGWTLFAIVWGLAIAGIVFKSLAIGRFERASAIVYLGMGWLAVLAAGPLIHALGWHGIAWLAAGGLAYSGGVLFYAFDHVRFFHSLWHLCVLAGSALHFFAVLFYVIPPR